MGAVDPGDQPLKGQTSDASQKQARPRLHLVKFDHRQCGNIRSAVASVAPAQCWLGTAEKGLAGATATDEGSEMIRPCCRCAAFLGMLAAVRALY